MTTAPVYFHIGYPKTGTTALQGEVFPRVDTLHVWANGALGLPTNWTEDQKRGVRLLHHLVWDDDWQPGGADIDDLLRLADPGDGRISLASYEALAGGLYYGDTHWLRNLQRLRQVFPNGRVIVVVREQRSMLSANRFPESDACDLDRLCYDRLVAQADQEFGADNVLVLVYEELSRAPATFLAALGSFLGVGDLARFAPEATRTRNASYSAPTLTMIRLTNRLFRASDLQPHPVLASRRLSRYSISAAGRFERVLARGRAQPPKVRLPESFAPVVAASNAALSGRCGTRLEEFGYLLPN